MVDVMRCRTTNKVRHLTLKRAYAAQRAMEASGKVQGVLNCYPCHHCGGYHVGRLSGKHGKKMRHAPPLQNTLGLAFDHDDELRAAA
jgi:hypothetical protein